MLAFATPYNDFKIGATYLSGNYFPVAHFFYLLFFILVVNVILGKVAPRKRLSAAELAFIWAMLTASSAIGSSGLMRYLIPQLPAMTYYATPENGWAESLVTNIPSWMQITHERAVWGFLEGLKGWEKIPWGQWAVPLLTWGLFTALLWGSFFFFSILIRAEWVDRERFTFPLVQLPLEVMEEPEPGHLLPRFFHSKPMWWTVSLLTVYHTLIGLNRLYPQIPAPPHTYRWVYGLPGIWSAFQDWALTIFPLVIGVSYLINNEVLFSLWFMFVLYRLVRFGMLFYGMTIAGVAVGYCDSALSSYTSAGASLVIVVWAFWVGRDHFASVFRGIFHRQPQLKEPESVSYRWATLGYLITLLGMIVWLMVAGVNLWMAFATIVVAQIAYIALAWIASQAGVLFLQGPFTGSEILTNLLGSKVWDPRSIVVPSIVENVYGVDLREYMLPQLVGAQKLADSLRANRKALLWAMVAAVIAGTIGSGWMAVAMPYHSGGGTALFNWWTYVEAPQRPLRYAASAITMPTNGNWAVGAGVIGGAIGCWLLLFLRSRLPWMSLHPAGWIAAGSYPGKVFGFSFFIAWVLKTLILRYGGPTLYRRARPVFMGLILGDTINGAIWIIVGFFTKQGYPLLPL